MMFKKFIPNYHYKSIFTIDYNKFKDMGIKYIMFDLDNTLIPYHETLPNEELIKLKEKLQADFKLMIVSNSHKERVKKFALEFAIPYVQFAKKPFKSGFKRAIEYFNITDNKTVLFIGDQLLTDIFGSNRIGFNSLLVDPLNRKTEALITRINRKLEAIVRWFTILFNKKSKSIFNNSEESNG